MRLSILAAFLIGLVGLSGAGHAQSRVALVIGNGEYQAVPPLPNPINDAHDISESLKRLGFDVKTLTNGRYDDMRRALIEFGRQARGSEIALVFFAGHGLEIGGKNYLIPVDAQLTTDLDAANESIDLTSVTQAVSNSAVLGLVILDACRNNPFLSHMQRTNLTRAVDRGFVRVEPADNVLVAYAARDGTTASDGKGRNSPFTSALLKNIEAPGVEISLLFRIVRDDVMAATNQRQRPFVYGSLSKEQIFLRSAAGHDGPNQPAPAVASPSASTPTAGQQTPQTVSTLTPAAIPPSASTETRNDLVKRLQAELARVGCYDGPNDGNWTTKTRSALANFNRQSGTSFDLSSASTQAVDGIHARDGRVCKPLNAQSEPQQLRPASSVSGPSSRPRGKKCFVAGGQSFCE